MHSKPDFTYNIWTPEHAVRKNKARSMPYSHSGRCGVVLSSLPGVLVTF